MKALGITMMDRVTYLENIGAITSDERKEYAGILQVAIQQRSTRFYNVLENKLRAKCKDSPSIYDDAFYEAIAAITQAVPTP